MRGPRREARAPLHGSRPTAPTAADPGGGRPGNQPRRGAFITRQTTGERAVGEDRPGRPDQARPPSRRAEFLADALAGLSGTRKALPGKYIWDEAGSLTFDRICESRDYYLTRRETALLRSAAPEVARLVGPGAALVEFGSGASVKSRIVLDALDRPARYVPID